MTHLQNRIEDSVELVEGMAFRIAKTALQTQDRNRTAGRQSQQPRRRRLGKKMGGTLGGGMVGRRSRTRRRNGTASRNPGNQRQHAGEAALDRLMGLLNVEREERFVHASQSRVSLRAVTGAVGVDAYLEDDEGEDLGRVGSGQMSSTSSSAVDGGGSVDLDLEKSIGLRPLSVGERSFVSQSARDAYDRMVLDQAGGGAVVKKKRIEAGGGLPADVDGFLSASINGW